jgi:hypothetical protein
MLQHLPLGILLTMVGANGTADMFEADEGIPLELFQFGTGRTARDAIQARGGFVRNGKVYGMRRPRQGRQDRVINWKKIWICIGLLLLVAIASLYVPYLWVIILIGTLMVYIYNL